VDNPLKTARELQERIHRSSTAELPTLADDLLLFLYRLKDEYRIVKSTGRSVTGRSFSVLDNLIYDLESSPDTTLTTTSSVEFVKLLLEDLVRGNILIQKK
jgi:hypothetical protein